MGRAARERALELSWGVAVDSLLSVFCGLAEERVLNSLEVVGAPAAD